MGGLNPEKVGAAMAIVAAWRSDPEKAAACPMCGAPGLVLTDCSARPHAEWYRLQCAACGLEAMLAIPLGSSVPGAS